MIDIDKLADEFLHGADRNGAYYGYAEDLKQFAEAYAAKVLEDKEREIAELKEKLTTELKRGGSYKLLVSSLEGQLEHYRNQDYTLAKARLDTLEQLLNSEREMNEILTNEITELQAHINDLREALELAEKALAYDVELVTEALSKTPAQSLQEHDNEVFERCAETAYTYLDDPYLSGHGYATGCSDAILALKGKQNGN